VLANPLATIYNNENYRGSKISEEEIDKKKWITNMRAFEI
jgi:hypothetical protein